MIGMSPLFPAAPMVSAKFKAAEIAATLTEQKAALTVYMKSKIATGDWHAVQDSGSDIREIDAKIEVLKEVGLL